MNILVHGVRFSMHVGSAQCGAKNVFEPKADSANTDDLFYMDGADPDGVRTIYPPPRPRPALLAH